MREIGEIAALLAAGVVPNLAYVGCGVRAARRLAPEAGRAETIALGYVLGSGFASLLILVLRLSDVPLPAWSLWVVAGATAPELLRGVREARSASARGRRWIDAATLSLFALTFASSLGPETFWDGFEYHLPMITAWSEGPIRALPGMLDAELRAGIDLLYLPAVAAGQPDAAASVSACFAGCLAALVRAEVGRRASAGAASSAALFTLLVPFTLQNAASTYVDLGVGAYGAVALLAAHRWNRSGRPQDLVLAALGIGFAANAKLQAAVLAPAILAMVALGGRCPPALTLARCAGIVLALVAPWLVKAAITSGNPLFPLLLDSFGSGFATPEHVALRRLRLATDYPERGVLGFGRYLVSLTFGGNPHVSGLLGALPLALLPAAVHRPDRPTAVLAGATLGLFALQYATMPALRFAAPLLPLVAIASAVGGFRLWRAGRVHARVLGVVLALLAVHHAAAALAFHVPRIASLRDPDAYRRAVFPDQIALRELVSQGRGVVAIPKGAVQWMERPVYVLHWERNGEIFFDPVLGRHTDPQAAHALLLRRGVGSVVVELRSPPPAPDRLGHPTADAWIQAGLASRRSDIPARRVRPDRVWVLIDLLPAMDGACVGDCSPR